MYKIVVFDLPDDCTLDHRTVNIGMSEKGIPFTVSFPVRDLPNKKDVKGIADAYSKGYNDFRKEIIDNAE